MSNAQIINKLRYNAELAQAAYGYFHLTNSNYKSKDLCNKDKERLYRFKEKYGKLPTFIDILNIEYKYYEDKNGKLQDAWYHKKFLGGDFSPNQAKHFFKRYELVKHIPDDKSGFSATIFYDKINSNYTVAFRGTK